jgi:hypothetical protein
MYPFNKLQRFRWRNDPAYLIAETLSTAVAKVWLLLWMGDRNVGPEIKMNQQIKIVFRVQILPQLS